MALKPSAMRRGDVEMWRVLDVRLPGDRQRQHEGVQAQHVQQRGQPDLVQHHEADQHEPAGQHVRDVEGQAVDHGWAALLTVIECAATMPEHVPPHHIPRETNSSSTPSRPSISAAPRKLGTRNTRIFATDISATPSATPPTAIFASQAAAPIASGTG